MSVCVCVCILTEHLWLSLHSTSSRYITIVFPSITFFCSFFCLFSPVSDNVCYLWYFNLTLFNWILSEMHWNRWRAFPGLRVFLSGDWMHNFPKGLYISLNFPLSITMIEPCPKCRWMYSGLLSSPPRSSQTLNERTLFLCDAQRFRGNFINGNNQLSCNSEFSFPRTNIIKSKCFIIDKGKCAIGKVSKQYQGEMSLSTRVPLPRSSGASKSNLLHLLYDTERCKKRQTQ